ncbi:hypothetical protein EYF80_005628 [Liparis tanakae]|uniref:Secreted protein n=1 Tax=Liparis tanakae TaxID=230148 RepID=A0A4Z2J2Y9_9TELE|nr:hypothetical protein EYF80_005628 [Liparis tanakae]
MRLPTIVITLKAVVGVFCSSSGSPDVLYDCALCSSRELSVATTAEGVKEGAVRGAAGANTRIPTFHFPMNPVQHASRRCQIGGLQGCRAWCGASKASCAVGSSEGTLCLWLVEEELSSSGLSC